MKRSGWIFLIGWMVMGSVCFTAAAQQTRHVAVSGDDAGNDCLDAAHPCATVAYALDAALPGDTVALGAGTFFEGDLTIRTDLTLRGAGADRTTLDADPANGGAAPRTAMIAPMVALLRAGERIAYKGASAGHDHVVIVEAGVTAHIEDLTIRDGGDLFTDNEQGGGIWNAGTLTLTRVVVRDNVASVASDFGAQPRGGGIWNGGTLTIFESLVENNAASGFLLEGGAGGGVWNEGTLVLERSTVSANQATDVQDACYGGGVFNAGTATIRNSTLSGNTLSCFEGGAGGGLRNTGVATVEAATITGNAVGVVWDAATAHGGGIASFGGTVTLRGSLVAGNAAERDDATADCTGALASDGANVVGSGTGCPADAADTTVAPESVFTSVLGPLADNGGPTPTHALLAGSPAVDAGSCVDAEGAAITEDQRGFTRRDGLCDAGSYEYGAETTPLVTVTVGPDAEPVVIPATGGRITYALAVTNLADASETVDLWIRITGPGVSITRGPVTWTLAPGETLTRTLRQNVPSGAPPGSYTLAAVIGDFPQAEDSSAFAWEKSASKGRVLAGDMGWETDLSPVMRAGTDAAPSTFALEENYPNPFNPSTNIGYTLPEAASVRLSVFDVLGREVAVLVEGAQPAGRHAVTWSAGALPSGLYVYRLKAGAFVETRTMMLAK
jgi:hypothetical protein